MYFPASLAMLFTLSLLTLSASAQLTQAFSTATAGNPVLPAVQGTVLSADGRPAPGVHVELDKPGTAVPITSTSTNVDGTFELYNIPDGAYELAAESVDSQVDDLVQIEPEQSQFTLVLRRNESPHQNPASTVSVAQIMVPENAEKLVRKASGALDHRQYDKAKSLLDCALQIDPQYAQALTLRGQIEMSQGDLPSARQDLETAVRVDPDYGYAYVSLGAIYNHESRFDDAMRVSERALALLPKAWQGYFELAKANIGKGLYERAFQMAVQAQRLSGNSFASVHLIKAYALLPMRLYKEAKYELRAFLSRDPNNSSAQQAQTLLAQIDAMPGTSAASH